MKRIFFFSVFFLFFSSVSAPAEDYPKIDISGYKKWEFKNLHVAPPGNYFLGMTQVGYSPNQSGLNWQERLKLSISGELSEKLKVTYDIEQQPDQPETFDIKVNYDNRHELLFGDFSAVFSGNEFASATKSLNGVQISSKGDNYDLTVIPSAKLRSQVQALTVQKGNNTRGPYSLGHGTIVEGSETIWLNGTQLTRKQDYTIDYFEGKVTFSKILSALDEFKYSFEYTNIADFFFPTLSKRNFMGVRGKYSFDPNPFKRDAEPVKFLTTSSFEAFPNLTYTGSLEGDDSEVTWEAVSEFRLENYPVEPFSEIVSFEGRTLVKNEDYSIDYTEGHVKLALKNVPDPENPLLILYRHYLITREAAAIPGTGSQGPYYFPRSGIQPKSEVVRVDGRIYFKDFDYTMDYDRGSVFFLSKISSTSQIDADYAYKKEEQKIVDESKKSLAVVGVTCMSESSKTGGGVATVDVPQEKVFINSLNTIYLSNLPLVPSSEGGRLTIQKNGVDLVLGVDYVIPSVEADSSTAQAIVRPSAKLQYINDPQDLTDGWGASTILVLTTIESTAEITAIYNYKKSIPGRSSGLGSGAYGPYYLGAFRNIVPGSDRIEVSTIGSSIIETYTRNSSTNEAYIQQKGYSINYYSQNPYITFNEPIPSDKSFTIYFRYIPPSSDRSQDLNQYVLGADVDVKYGSLLRFTSEIATSYKDNITSRVSSSESFFVDGKKTNTIVLGKTPLSGSDMVSINGFLRNRDIDYSIDYDKGIISIYYLTLSSADAVVVSYDYDAATKIDNTGVASKYGVSGGLGYFSAAYNKRDVGKSFSPMGGMTLGQGSNSQDFFLKFDPKFHDLALAYSYKETNDPLSSGSSRFYRSFDSRYDFGLNPNRAANINFGIRKNRNISDDFSRKNELTTYAGSIVPVQIKKGVLTFDQNYSWDQSESDDAVARSKSKSGRLYFKEEMGVAERLKLGYDYSISEPETLSNIGTTLEAISSKTLSRSYSYNANMDFTGFIPKIQKWTGYAKYVKDERLTVKPSAATLETQNTTYHMDLKPFSTVTALLDYNRAETPSITVAGKNPKGETTTVSFKIDPSSRLNGSIAYSENATIHDTGRESSGRSNSYTFAFMPVKTKAVELSSSYLLYYKTSRTPSGSFEVEMTDQKISQDYSVTFYPLKVLTVSPGFNFEDYWRVKSDENFLKTSSQTAKCKAVLQILGYTLSADYNNKMTSNAVTGDARFKSLFDLQLSCQVLSWGKLVLGHNYEDNRGEVLSTGAFPAQNYQKKTNQISVNFNVPQDVPVLTSTLFTASFKEVSYVNQLKPSDNIDAATMMTFEGTMNF